MDYPLALLAGALLALSFPKFGHPVVAWIAVVPLLIAILRRGGRPSSSTSLRSFGLGLATGGGYFAGTLYWIVGVMQTYGGLGFSVVRQSIRAGTQLLTTITNDAWFGDSSAPYQHFTQAAMRAIEQGRYLARSANTGISGIVDPYGRIVVQSALFERNVLDGEVRFLSGLTVYARIGDGFAYLCGLLTIAAVVVGFRAAPSNPDVRSTIAASSQDAR